MLLAMLLLQLLSQRYDFPSPVNVDFFFLVIVYFAVNSSFIRTMVMATVLGLISDCLSGGIIGVFSFSRILASFLVNQASRFIDFRRPVFVFFTVFLSLVFANTVAAFFLFLIMELTPTITLIVFQPLATAGLALVLINFKPTRRYINVP